MKPGLRRIAFALILPLPSLAAGVWSCWPALQAVFAVETLKKNAPWAQDGGLSGDYEIQRRIQRHFLNYSIYIPLEDIFVTAAGDKRQESAALLMQKACGQGTIYVWIPLRFRMPAAGEKVVEWCWKPRIAKS